MSKSVLKKIVESKRMPVLFIGSGISRRYLYKYPNWEELLKTSFYKVNPDPYYYQKHFDQLSRQGLSDFDIYTSLGTIIEDDFNNAFFERKIKLNIGGKNPNWVKKGISPYKMYLSNKFKKMKLYQSPVTYAELEQLRSLKTKISAVITTNYDTFLEDMVFASDYEVFVRQNDLFSPDSYNIAEIYKIHGSVTDAESIMITKKDYNDFTNSRKLIIAKMLTLFAESPIIFLGFSFTDTDIQNVINDFLGCLTPKELENIEEHFIFISYKKGEQELIEIKRTITTLEGNQIPITEIQTDNFLEVYKILNQIIPGISPKKIRETRKLVKNIVDHSMSTGDADSIIVNIDDLDKIDLSQNPLAIAIGYRENILNTYGYGLVEQSIIFEDILYNNQKLDAHAMCTTRFKSLPYTQLLPVFKYVKAYGQPIDCDSKLGVYIEKHNSFDLIISNGTRKLLKNTPETDDYGELKDWISSVADSKKKSAYLLKIYIISILLRYEKFALKF